MTPEGTPPPPARAAHGPPSPAEEFLRRLAKRPLASHLPLVLICAIALHSGLAAIDFGPHWDDPWNREALERVVQTQIFLEQRYHHAFVQFDLAVFSTAIAAVMLAWRGEVACQGGWFACFSKAVQAPDYILTLRAVFLIATLLSLPAVYLLVWRWRKSALEAALAAGTLGLSWEFAYHARWVAPDNLLVTCASLVALFLVLAWEGQRRGVWLRRAAAAAGLGLATKYPGGLLLLPVLLSAWAGMPNQEAKARLRLALACGFWFAAAALLVSPGAYLQPLRLATDLDNMFQLYRKGHFGYTIAPGLPHFAALFSWLVTVFDSPWVPAAVFLSAPAALGAFELIREEPRRALAWLSFPVAYLGYFSAQRVMIVRNLLCVAPFLAVLSARGLSFLSRRLPRPAGPAVIAAALLCLAGNAVWLEVAAATVRTQGRVNPFAELTRFQDSHPGLLVVSQGVQIGLLRSGFSVHTLPASAAPPEARAVFSSTEVGMAQWQMNKRDRYQLLPTGPFEVNWDYYATWVGNPRLVFTRVDEARAMGIPLAD